MRRQWRTQQGGSLLVIFNCRNADDFAINAQEGVVRQPARRQDSGSLSSPPTLQLHPWHTLLKICIASPDIIGPIRNGGVGTACTALAQTLANEGHSVYLIYTSDYAEDDDFNRWSALYEDQGIHLIDFKMNSEPPVHPTPNIYGPDIIEQSYRLYQYLRQHEFDCIHLVDYMGLGYFTALSKHLGLCFKNTEIVVTVHGPVMWSRPSNSATIDDITFIFRDQMERRLVQYCDTLISPSKYMIDWMVSRSWAIPSRSFVLPNLIPQMINEINCSKDKSELSNIDEIVFFGRIEPRKGLLIFCDAIDRINRLIPPHISIAFLGKLGDAYDIDMLRARTASWKRKVNFHNEFDTFEAISYLLSANRLAVICPLIDNSPYTVLECLHYQIPFVASDVGGIPELIDPDDHPKILVKPTPASLAKGILRACSESAHTPAASLALDKLRQRHLAIYERCTTPPGPSTVAPDLISEPLVTVTLLHRDRPIDLRRALDSIQCQSYQSIEVIVVDNGSVARDAIDLLNYIEHTSHRFQTRVIRMKENVYEPRARNAAANLANGKYILFMDDDNVAKIDEIATFCQVAERQDYDILTCFGDYFVTDEPPASDSQALKRFVVIGDCGLAGLIINGFGDLNCFVRKTSFELVGGFTVDDRFNHAEDWRFFTKALGAGLKHTVVPEALFWYRTDPTRYGRGWRKHDRGGALDRAISAYSFKSTEFEPLIRLSQGLFWRSVQMNDENNKLRDQLKDNVMRVQRLSELLEQSSITNDRLISDIKTLAREFEISVTMGVSPQNAEQARLIKAVRRLSALSTGEAD